MVAEAVWQKALAARGLIQAALIAVAVALALPQLATDVRASAADVDLDGLPDDWEQRLADADPTDGVEGIWDVLPEGDFDGDGGSNAEELFWGTDPVVAETKLALDWADAVARLRDIGRALLEYQADHGPDVLPGRLQWLVTEGYLQPDQLTCRADPFHGAQGGMPNDNDWGSYQDIEEAGSSFLYEFSGAPCSWRLPGYDGPTPPTWYDMKMYQLAGGLEGGPYDRRVLPVVRCFWFEYTDYTERRAHQGCVYDRQNVRMTVANLAIDCRSVLGSESYWENTAGHLTPDNQAEIRSVGEPSEAGEPHAVVGLGECIEFPLWPKVRDVADLCFRLVPDGEGRAYGNLSRNVFAWTPDADAPASVTITVEMYREDGATDEVLATASYRIDVARNQTPWFTPGTDQVVAEDAGPQTVAGWATGIDDGDAAVVQELSFTVTTDNDALFAVLPSLDAPTGDLTYTPAPDANGSATVTVTLTDDASAGGPARTTAAQTFTLTGTPVNDPPTLTGVAATAAVEGGTSTLTATLEDVDDATLDVTVAWGDGLTDTYPGVAVGVLRLSHTYADDNMDDAYSITVTVTDAGGLGAHGAATATVSNSAPTGLALAPLRATGGTAYAGALSASDVAGDPLTWTKTGGATWLVVAPGGTVTGTPGDTDTGSQLLEVLVDDGDGGVSTAAFAITVAMPARHALWDFTGHYEAAVHGAPLTLDLVHDTRGRLTGTALLQVVTGKGAVLVRLSIRGSVTGSSGAVAASMALRGTQAGTGISVDLAVELTLHPATRQLSGPVRGSLKVGGVRTPVSNGVTLDVPSPMDGTWTLQFDLSQATRGVAGTALLWLSNGGIHRFAAAGRAAGAVTELALSSLPSDPATRGITIRTTIAPLAGGGSRLGNLSLKGYGQTLNRSG